MSWTAVAIGGAAVVGGAATAYSGKKAAEASERGNNNAIAATTAATEQAREDVNRLFPQAQRTANAGFNSAQDIYQQMMPMQQNAFQGGNVAAQQAILSGLPQIQNALMGGNIDYSGFQPYLAQTPSQFDFTKINQMKALSNLPGIAEASKGMGNMPQFNSFGSVAPTTNTGQYQRNFDMNPTGVRF